MKRPSHTDRKSQGESLSLRNHAEQLQREYPSQQRRNIAAPQQEYHRNTYRVAQPVLDRPHMTREAHHTSLFVSSDDSQFVDFQKPKEIREVHVITTNEPSHRRPDEPPHRRRLSQRILPSVEVDDSDIRDSGHIPREAISHHQDITLREDAARGRLRYAPRPAVEHRSQNERANLKRIRDEDDVYIISERPRAPAMYEDQDHNAIVFTGEHAPARIIHQRAIEPVYDKEPHVVEYDPRIIQLPSRVPDRISKSHQQIQPEVRPGHDEAGRSVGLSHGPNTAVSYENRPISRVQVVQPMSSPESHRIVNIPSHPDEHKRAPGLQPAVSRIVRLESPRDGSFFMPTEPSSRNVQYYNEQGRALRDGTMPRREVVTYVSSNRAMG